VHDFCWKNGYEAPSVLKTLPYQRGESKRMEDGIGIGEEKPLPTGSLCKLPACPGFTNPSLGKWGSTEDSQSLRILGSEMFKDVQCGIRRFIIQHHDFVGGIFLATEGVEAGGNAFGFVPCRH